MYADVDSRGGVLEPEGIVGIKFRKDKQLETMARLDPTYAELKRAAAASGNLTGEKLAELKAKITKREELLLPIYSQISLQFADLHDRAGRMEAKGTIRQPLQWRNARRFFYWRLRRRLQEESILKRMLSSSSSSTVQQANGKSSADKLSRSKALDTLRAWTSLANFEKDDKEVSMWYEANGKEITAKVNGLVTEGVAFDVASLLLGNKEGGLRGVKQVLEKLPVEEREGVLKFLRSQ